MLTKVVIVENDNLHTWSLENMFEQLGNYQILATFVTAEEALPFIIKNEAEINILLVDILLDGEKRGTDLVLALKNRHYPVIFMTEWKDESLYRQLLNLPNHAFLVKPFHRFTLDSTIKVLLSKVEIPKEPKPENSSDRLYVRVGTKQEVLNTMDINWIVSNRNYCCIHTEKKQYTIKRSMKLVYAMLPSDKFIFIHQSYIVRLSLIKKIDIKALQVVVGDHAFPLGRTFIKNLRQKFQQLG